MYTSILNCHRVCTHLESQHGKHDAKDQEQTQSDDWEAN